MIMFYVFAALVVWQSIISLAGGRRYLAYVRGALAREWPPFKPFASVIVPCRGVDQGLRENIAALFVQDYPAYEIIFATDRADDAALPVIDEVRRQYDGRGGVRGVRTIVAGRATTCGQKVHNLRAAVAEIDAASEALVFVDTDARPRAGWLGALVAPLVDERIGATTGYRWFVPERGGAASHLRAVWNASIASALGADGRRNFCWGGSTAIRRATFERLNVRERWRGTLSDDFALTRVLHEAKLPIHFAPACLVASHEDCSFRELFEFTTRQLKITRVYAPHLWLIVLFSNLLFASVFFGGIALVVARAAAGVSFSVPLIIIVTIFALGAGKAWLRLRAVKLSRTFSGAHISTGAHLLLWPLTALVYLYNALAALVSRRIVWRGIGYELKSPTETVNISRAAPEVERAPNV